MNSRRAPTPESHLSAQHGNLESSQPALPGPLSKEQETVTRGVRGLGHQGRPPASWTAGGNVFHSCVVRGSCGKGREPMRLQLSMGTL